MTSHAPAFPAPYPYPQERVVYLLGAGFSAPLGLPLMGNFLSKSWDLEARYPKKCAHFRQVFEQINQMSVAKNVYHTDLLNIEEILSILEMQEFAGAARLRREFVRYVSDVVELLTPALPKPTPPDKGDALQSIFRDANGDGASEWIWYGEFVTRLLGALVIRADNGRDPNRLVAIENEWSPAVYSVITLNYDRVLEQVGDYLRDNIPYGRKFGFARPGIEGEADAEIERPTLLAKLHGSVEDESIVPPTWSKGRHDDIVPAWAAALETLASAHHIRVIGYSLPESDAYIKYLLRAAAMRSTRLKTFDVICLDRDGSVADRYRRFVGFRDFRFASLDSMRYLVATCDRRFSQSINGLDNLPSIGSGLEHRHAEVMAEFR
jgi:hypothetical protein